MPPTFAVPVTTGRPIDASAACGATGPTRLAYAVAVPAESFAVTVSPSVLPRSAAVSLYVGRAAPEMTVQPLPSASQRFHAYEYAIVPDPDQIPLEPVDLLADAQGADDGRERLVRRGSGPRGARRGDQHEDEQTDRRGRTASPSTCGKRSGFLLCSGGGSASRRARPRAAARRTPRSRRTRSRRSARCSRAAAQKRPAALRARVRQLGLELLEPPARRAAPDADGDPVAEHLPALLAQPVGGLAHGRTVASAAWL